MPFGITIDVSDVCPAKAAFPIVGTKESTLTTILMSLLDALWCPP
jgi:hypothetical protein